MDLEAFGSSLPKSSIFMSRKRSADHRKTTPMNSSPALKPKVALDAIKRVQTVIDLSQISDDHPNQFLPWMNQLFEQASPVVEQGENLNGLSVGMRTLQTDMGQSRPWKIIFLAGTLNKAGLPSAKRWLTDTTRYPSASRSWPS